MSLRKARPCLAATLWVAAVLTVGCASTSPPSPPPPPDERPLPPVAPELPDHVTFRDRTEAVKPYADVMITLGLDDALANVTSLDVTPETAVIWVRSRNPVSQLMWMVRCVGGHGIHDDVTCPGNVQVTIEPKGECSRTLFGTNREPGSGRFVIPARFNAISGGRPSLQELLGDAKAREPEKRRGLMALEAESATFCDGETPKAKFAAMKMTQSESSHMWSYSVVVTQKGKVVASIDPGVWIEDEGGG